MDDASVVAVGNSVEESPHDRLRLPLAVGSPADDRIEEFSPQAELLHDVVVVVVLVEALDRHHVRVLSEQRHDGYFALWTRRGR